MKLKIGRRKRESVIICSIRVNMIFGSKVFGSKGKGSLWVIFYFGY